MLKWLSFLCGLWALVVTLLLTAYETFKFALIAVPLHTKGISGGDKVALGIAPHTYTPPPPPPHLLGFLSPPVPIRRELGVKRLTKE